MAVVAVLVALKTLNTFLVGTLASKIQKAIVFLILKILFLNFRTMVAKSNENGDGSMNTHEHVDIVTADASLEKNDTGESF